MTDFYFKCKCRTNLVLSEAVSLGTDYRRSRDDLVLGETQTVLMCKCSYCFVTTEVRIN